MIITYSCKKDDQNSNPNESVADVSLKMTDAEMLTHIEDFIDDVEYILDNPNETYTETMSVEDVVFNIEAAMSLQYVYYVKTSDKDYETNYLDITCESNGEVKHDNMAALYDEVYDILKDHYTDASYNQKKLVLVDLYTQSGGNGTQLVIYSAVGNTLVSASNYDEDWRWGLKEGYCDPPNTVDSDAAEQIEIELIDHFYATPTNPNCKYFHTHTKKYSITDAGDAKWDNPNDDPPSPHDNYKDYLIFYGTSEITATTWSDVECVYHEDELPFYEECYINEFEKEETSTKKVFFIDIKGVIDYQGNYTILKHDLYFEVGTRWLMCNTNYPQPIG